jgi:hypothetical protein
LNSVKTEDDIKTFDKPHIPIAVLLEGKFSSLYSNRLSQSTIDSFTTVYNQPFLSSALVPNKMIVVSDADIASNDFSPQDQRPLEMGFNRFTQAQYANKEFILNCIEYLTIPLASLKPDPRIIHCASWMLKRLTVRKPFGK